MKAEKTYLIKLASLLMLLLCNIVANAQISLTSTAGIPTGNYTTLKACFDAINAGVHQGVININVNASVVETATATLNASGGLSSYTHVNIQPTTTCSISGKIAGPLIFLNGADSVTIDGRIGGTGTARSLTISNSYDSTVAAAYTIYFTNFANRNTIRYTICEGLGQTNYTNGTIYGQGTQYNKIDNCEIRPVGNGLQNIGIRFVDTVVNNLIHDFYCKAWGVGAGIYGCSYIKNNSLYHTNPVNVASVSFVQFFVYGGGYVKNNFIGGSAPQCNGTPGILSATNTGMYFTGIFGSIIDSNIISNIKIISPSGLSGWFSGISFSVNGSNAIVSNNTIGSMTDTSSIDIINGGVAGIAGNGGQSMSKVSIYSNKIGGLSISSNFVLSQAGLISVDDLDSGTLIGNIIGGNFPNSIHYTSRCQTLSGINIWRAKPNGKIICNDNIIRNINYENMDTTTCEFDGIYSGTQYLDTGSKRWFVGNQIYNLRLTKQVGDASLKGITSTPSIAVPAGVNNTIHKNNVYNLFLEASGSNSTVMGINQESSYNLYLSIDSNHIENLLNVSANANNNVNAAVQGIRVLSASNGTAKVAYNTIRNIESKSSGSTSVIGVNCFYSGTMPFSISGNNIYNLVNDSTSLGEIAGMKLGGGASGNITADNNMIALQSDSANVFGISNNTTLSVIGLYYNSVHIKGTALGNSISSNFIREAYANTNLTLQNNIFQNELYHPNGRQYLIMNGNANPDTGWVYSNYNNFYDTNANEAILWGNADLSINAFKSVSQTDSCSQNQFTYFVYPDTGNLHLAPNPTHLSLVGKSVTGINVDFDNDVRNPFPTIGADELLLPFQGAVIAAQGATQFCDGDSVVLRGNQNINIQWLKNGQPILNATDDSFVVHQSGNYALYYDDGCLYDTSNTVAVNVTKVNDSVSQNGAVLTALGQGSYQWFDCNNFSVVLDTQQVFTATQNGNYAVVVTLNNCSDTSDCYLVNSLLVNSIEDSKFLVYPNPFTANMSIRGITEGDKILLIDMSGKQVMEMVAKKTTATFETTVIQPGYYILSIYLKNGRKLANIPVVHK